VCTKNISFRKKFWGQNTMFDPPGKFPGGGHLTPGPLGSRAHGVDYCRLVEYVRRLQYILQTLVC